MIRDIEHISNTVEFSATLEIGKNYKAIITKKSTTSGVSYKVLITEKGINPEKRKILEAEAVSYLKKYPI